MTTLTIMRYLPREVDPLVYNMSHEDPGDVTYSEIGGLGEQIRELREVIELPLLNPELFMRVGITPPKGFQSCHYLNIFVTLWSVSTDFGHKTAIINFIIRLPSVRATWNRKDLVGKSSCQSARRKLPQSGLQRDRGQVHWRVGPPDQGDVQLCKGPPALHHLHGRD